MRSAFPGAVPLMQTQRPRLNPLRRSHPPINRQRSRPLQ